MSGAASLEESLTMKTALILAGTALLAAPLYAQATAPTSPNQSSHPTTGNAGLTADLTAGTAVVDSTGAPVGTIDSVSASGAIVNTGTAKATLPLVAFAKRDNGVAIGLTKAQLEAAVAQAKPQPATSIAAGATVSDPQGGAVGTVAAVQGDLITVQTANSKANLPKTAFAQGPNGLVIGMTAAQLDAAAKAAAPK
jgi:hypothetical protein